MEDDFKKLTDIIEENNLFPQTAVYLVGIKIALEEKEKLEQALDKASDIIYNLNHCSNIDYPVCPFRKDCADGKAKSCLATEEYWKKYLMEL